MIDKHLQSQTGTCRRSLGSRSSQPRQAPRIGTERSRDPGAGDAGPTCRAPTRIQHVVFLMQENRSFDHYFGKLGGVAGFDDTNNSAAFTQAWNTDERRAPVLLRAKNRPMFCCPSQ